MKTNPLKKPLFAPSASSAPPIPQDAPKAKETVIELPLTCRRDRKISGSQNGLVSRFHDIRLACEAMTPNGADTVTVVVSKKEDPAKAADNLTTYMARRARLPEGCRLSRKMPRGSRTILLRLAAK